MAKLPVSIPETLAHAAIACVAALLVAMSVLAIYEYLKPLFS